MAMADPSTSVGTKIVSLVKYDRPEPVQPQRKGAQQAHREFFSIGGACGTNAELDEALIQRCKESNMSQIETDQILNSIAQPREWEEEGKRYRQLISKIPATRADILDLNDSLNEQLTNRQARPDGICPIRRELADQAFDELIRQITISQPERGLLLLRITGVQKAVNPDPENYWTETKVCGGVLVSQTGRISYKPSDYYNNHERCTWTVRANHRSKIRVTLTSGAMEEVHDYVGITELINGNVAEWKTKRLISGQTDMFEGPLILVTFVSDGSIRRKGFQLEFEGMGSNVNAKLIYRHFHFSDWMGQFASGNLSESLANVNLKAEGKSPVFATVVINPSNWNESKLLVSTDLHANQCEQTNLTILNDFAVFPNGVSHGCGDETCEVSNFDSTNGITLGILKSPDLPNDDCFHMTWSTDTSDRRVESVDKCGGILTGNSGKILYKENTLYYNNERCVWIIKAEDIKEGEMKVQLVKDGFEQQYDYVTLSFLNHNRNEDIFETKFLYKSGAPLQIPSPFVLVEFYSDAATFGKSTGFELIWEIKQTSNTPVLSEFDYHNEPNGNKLLSCTEHHKENRIEQILIINTQQETKHNRSLLTLQTEVSFAPEELSLFASEKANFSEVKCAENGYQSEDGILVILRKCSDSSGELPIKWKTEEIPETGESPHHQLYVKSDDTCGEVLFGDSGRITYKMGKEYDLNERCTWIIRAKTHATITVQLMADGFESCCDGVQINKINAVNGIIDPTGISISRENRFHTLDATALLVTFLSDHSVKGTGFVLEFQTKGNPMHDSSNSFDVKHWNVKLESRPTLENPFGPIFINISDNLLSIDTFAFQHVEIAISNISLDLKIENLHVSECNQDSVTLYHMPTLGKYEILKKVPSAEHCSVEKLAGRNAITAFLASEQEKFQLNPKGVLVVVTKIIANDAEKSVSLTFA